MKKRLLTYSLLTLLLVLFGGWLSTQIEWYEKSRWQGFQGEAKYNPHLAASWFLRHMGVPARTLISPEQLNELPANDAVLILPTQRLTFSEARNNDLLDWAAAGGHLMIQAIPDYGYSSDYDDDEEDIADEDELEFEEDVVYDPIADQVYVYSNYLDYDETLDGAGTTTFELDDSDDLLEIDFDDLYALEYTENREILRIGDVFGDRVISVPYEQGLITVVSDMDWIENISLDEHGHARLLFYLVTLHGTPSEVIILNSDDMPPLWEWLWHVNPWLISLSGLLLLMWLWRAPWRFGPLLPADEAPRRRILEHIQAAGHYLWNSRQPEALLEGLRNDLIYRALQTHPDMHRLSAEQRIHRLADVCNLPAEQVHQALLANHPRNRQAFLQQVNTIETIRKQL